MARKRVKKYKGKSVCKTSTCSGHRAGARYARQGGNIPSPNSRSFNAGMQIENGTFVTPRRRRKTP